MTGLVCVTRRVDDPGPLLDRVPARGGLAWVTGRDGLVGHGAALRVAAGPTADRMAEAQARFDAFVADPEVDDDVAGPGTGPVAFGSFTFADTAVGSVLVVPEVVVGRQGSTSWVTRIGPADEVAAAFADDPLPPVQRPEHDPEADRPRHAGASVPDVRWLEAVAAAVDRIDAGELAKVVLARDVAVWAEAPFDVRVLARRLHRRFPGCATFVVDGFVGASPELFVELTGRHLTSTSLAGTAPRAEDPAFDRVRNRVLLNAWTAIGAARREAADRGYGTCVLSSRMRGEARQSALAHVAVAEEVADTGNPVGRPGVLLSGGELTVTVRGAGVGGPSLEFALRAALDLPDGAVLAAVDTDGRDGSTDAAGAVVDAGTVDDPRAARRALADNDAYGYLGERDALVVTGRTGTNVNDLRVVLVPESGQDSPEPDPS